MGPRIRVSRILRNKTASTQLAGQHGFEFKLHTATVDVPPPLHDRSTGFVPNL